MGADCKSVAQATMVRIHHLPLEGAGSDGIWRLLHFADFQAGFNPMLKNFTLVARNRLANL
jgi:hypothetical protein